MNPSLPRETAGDATPVGPATARSVLRGALPPARRFWWSLASGFASEASAVALLAVSAWLIVRASEQPPVLYLSAAVVGVRFFGMGLTGIVAGTMVAVVGRCALWMPWYVHRVVSRH